MIEALQRAGAATVELLPFVAVVYGVGLAIERIAPIERRQPLGHLAFNVAWTLLFLFLTMLLVPLALRVVSPLVAQYGGWVPIQMPDGIGWQLLQGLIFLFIFDFFYYWFHRAQHEFPLLWAQHQIHHSERSLNVTSGNRHHWLEEVMRAFVILLPLQIVFDVKPPNIGWLWMGLSLWGYFIHLNLRVPLGPLTPWLGGPQLHRLHHSIEPQHLDRNYAAFFPIWDRLFGTYVAPKPGEYPRIGLVDGRELNGLWKASVAPFVDGGRWLSARFGLASRSPARPADS